MIKALIGAVLAIGVLLAIGHAYMLGLREGYGARQSQNRVANIPGLISAPRTLPLVPESVSSAA